MKRFAEALLRKELKQYHKSKVQEAKSAENSVDLFSILSNQRCEIALEH
jgi:hypothetical protein